MQQLSSKCRHAYARLCDILRGNILLSLRNPLQALLGNIFMLLYATLPVFFSFFFFSVFNSFLHFFYFSFVSVFGFFLFPSQKLLFLKNTYKLRCTILFEKLISSICCRFFAQMSFAFCLFALACWNWSNVFAGPSLSNFSLPLGR